MGVSVGFGLGPVRVSKRIGGGRKRRSHPASRRGPRRTTTGELQRLADTTGQMNDRRESYIQRRLAVEQTWAGTALADRPFGTLTVGQLWAGRRWFRVLAVTGGLALVALTIAAPFLLLIDAAAAAAVVASHRRDADVTRRIRKDVEYRAWRDNMYRENQAVAHLLPEDRSWLEAHGA